MFRQPMVVGASSGTSRNPQFGVRWRRKLYFMQTAQRQYSTAVKIAVLWGPGGPALRWSTPPCLAGLWSPAQVSHRSRLCLSPARETQPWVESVLPSQRGAGLYRQRASSLLPDWVEQSCSDWSELCSVDWPGKEPRSHWLKQDSPEPRKAGSGGSSSAGSSARTCQSAECLCVAGPWAQMAALLCSALSCGFWVSF